MIYILGEQHWKIPTAIVLGATILLHCYSFAANIPQTAGCDEVKQSRNALWVSNTSMKVDVIFANMNVHVLLYKYCMYVCVKGVL